MPFPVKECTECGETNHFRRDAVVDHVVLPVKLDVVLVVFDHVVPPVKLDVVLVVVDHVVGGIGLNFMIPLSFQLSGILWKN